MTSIHYVNNFSQLGGAETKAQPEYVAVAVAMQKEPAPVPPTPVNVNPVNVNPVNVNPVNVNPRKEDPVQTGISQNLQDTLSNVPDKKLRREITVLAEKAKEGKLSAKNALLIKGRELINQLNA